MTENRQIGIEELRGRLGDLVDDAHFDGTITHITRHGRHVASLIPAGMKAAAIPAEALEVAVDAAWPGLPPGMTMSEARRRVIAALNAALPYLVEPEEQTVLPDLSELNKRAEEILTQIQNPDSPVSPENRQRLRDALADLEEIISRTGEKLSHQKIITAVIEKERGSWDPERTIRAAARMGCDIDARRARAILRRIANTGLIVKVSDTRAIYETVEESGP